MKICFAGDVFIGGDLATSPQPCKVDLPLFFKADLRIANFEQSLSNLQNPEFKSTLYSQVSSAHRLKELCLNVALLGNNHVLDQGERGFDDTLRTLDGLQIRHVGAGRSSAEAGAPLYLADGLCLLSYCEYKQKYLGGFRVAGPGSYGINPLEEERIFADLERLPVGVKAIVAVHWGRENSWLPTTKDLRLARRLLAHESVSGVIGGHPHRIQGYIQQGKKRCYFSTGNFIFSNFFVREPSQIAYPSQGEQFLVTQLYHSVHQLTHMRWPLANRVGLIVSYDLTTLNFTHSFVFQSSDGFSLTGLRGLSAIAGELWLAVLSLFCRMPISVFRLIDQVNALWIESTYWLRVRWWALKTQGFSWGLRKAFQKIFS